MKRALVLSGGSIKGAFQAGAIAEVLEDGFEPDIIYGTSVGSLNGGFLAERAGRAAERGEEPDWPAIGADLEAFWRNEVSSFSQVGRTRGPFELFWQVFRTRFDGLIDTSPLQRLVKEVLDADNLRSSPVDFSACAVNVADGRLRYATPEESNILDYIIASTAIPITMPIKRVGGEPFVDGGIREVAPLNQACEDGAGSVVCVVCDPEEMGAVSFDLGDLRPLSDRLMAIVVNELVNNDLQRFHEINEMVQGRDEVPTEGPLAGKRYIPIICIRPKRNIPLDLEHFTPQQIDEMLKMGRRVAREILDASPPEWHTSSS
ncbi:MAG: patatin-like phospholipase family protein [Chloroflexota bacterium]|nr:patatin-like phospholipase family protein [Chloroflexota bacterium]